MSVDPERLARPSCPAPQTPDCVTLSHGAGAGASARLFEDLIWPPLANPLLGQRHDGAVLALGGAARLAFTTDTFVVRPLEFPGGDIGALAVHGTLNDLAMCGAQPLALSCGLVLEEGLPLATLERVMRSIGRAAAAAAVPVATGDTKVVERGRGDGIYVNTSGIGRVPAGRDLRPQRVRAGDAILVSGPLGCHGAAVLSVREGLAFESDVASDTAYLGPLVEALLAEVPETHCLRDPTRGGLGAALHEIAPLAGVELEIDESALPIPEPVRAACELLGLDPWFLAAEGCLIGFVPEAEAERALAALRTQPLGAQARCIGRAVEGRPRVVARTPLGSRRAVLLPAGEGLPRIC